MKSCVALFFISMLMISCGVESNRFKIEGRFLNLNQGEFYVYSTDGVIDGMDTIKIQGGRFVYEIPCKYSGTLMMVFPNFSEQPVFAQPGKSVNIEGDASHLKEMTVTGTKDNELMNRFRESIVNASPPEMVHLAEQFATDNASSPVSVYLVRRYFVDTPTPDYRRAYRLVEMLITAQPNNGVLVRMKNELKQLAKTFDGAPLPAFSAVATNGERVSQNTCNKAQIAVFNVWASYNMESMEIQRTLKTLLRSSHGKLRVVSICMDADRRECADILKRDSISWANICDGRMFESAVAKQLGICSVPYNLVLRNGKIIARGLNPKQLQEKLEPMF